MAIEGEGVTDKQEKIHVNLEDRERHLDNMPRQMIINVQTAAKMAAIIYKSLKSIGIRQDVFRSIRTIRKQLQDICTITLTNSSE